MSVALYINNVEVPLTKGSWQEKRSHYQITGQTEAGTNRRDLIRGNILGLSVKLTTDDADKATIEGYNALSSLTVKYYNNGVLTSWDAYMDNLSCNLLADDAWDVSFDLIDMEQ